MKRRRFGHALSLRKRSVELGSAGAVMGAITGYFATHPHHDGLSVMQSRAFGGAEGAVAGAALGVMIGMMTESVGGLV